MNHKKGFTLLEVIISMVFISVVLMAFLSLFGTSTIAMSKGRNITNETFSFQEKIENEIIKTKNEFVAGTILKDENISIFSGGYGASVEVKNINQHIYGNRYYKLAVSNVKIAELPAPDITVFKVAPVPNNVFPWKDNITRIDYNYSFTTNPKIANVRTRWYESKSDNTVNYMDVAFPSGYENLVAEEKDVNEPAFTSGSGTINPKENHFYYFELRAYTFAGKLAYRMNEDRILVLKRAGSPYWQALMEKIFIKDSSIFLKTDSIYELFQNQNKPTLNLGSNTFVDSQGPMLTTDTNPSYNNNNFKASINFQADKKTRDNPDAAEQGLGVFIGDTSSSGIMYTMDAKNNKLKINKIDSGMYSSLIQEINLDGILEFRNNAGEFNWEKDYKIQLKRMINTVNLPGLPPQEVVTLEVFLAGKDISNVDKTVDLLVPIEDPLIKTYNKIGFKSYSSLQYQPELSETVGKYTRNYGGHFFDVVWTNN